MNRASQDRASQDSAPQDGKLTFDECWDLLAASVVGRLALIVDGHPEIFPVNFVIERRSIVFRTAGGTKLWQSGKETPAAFEIDGYDADSQEAWSVVARGTTTLVDSNTEQAAADALGLDPWEPGDKSRYVRLSLQVLTGRRFKVAAPHIWSTRLQDQRRSSFE
ncbi:pyridoxamine 5'-phosphate oxidase family protein [Arthrobacter sp. ISL-65]|uniref:pyridoxamine 5'-phosphate oxidase family protein n=1 Tax=Arthrobacter sp. ISL-65 TaxID=2819112 RepID=UPI001BEC05A0|nr:pyridoxamine 5'-phosphate oxidase family protein [Arthrobacter sp. ISL-65]MBT2550134.1 pyridoxamine 5'-phosphate oxidase family protein [Arthrobacter sp. ISL-65]